MPTLRNVFDSSSRSWEESILWDEKQEIDGVEGRTENPVEQEARSAAGDPDCRRRLQQESRRD